MSIQEHTLRTNRSRFRSHDFPVTFTNYTRCFAKVIVAYDRIHLTGVNGGAGATSVTIGATMDRNEEVQSFIIIPVDERSRDGVADRKIIDNKRCRISIYLISPQRYYTLEEAHSTHRKDLNEWSLVCSNVSLNASKYNYNILSKHEKLCVPRPTLWI